jgi:four helix bundle protein
MNKEDIKSRTKEFAKRIITLGRNLPSNREGRLIGNQLFRSGTSIAANYRAVCRARSKVEFIAKLGIVEEEADETLFWLELLKEMEIIKPESLESLLKENNEIILIIVTTIKTAKRKNPKSEI